jgi:predicted NAD/FAD-binding protein
MRVAVLGGGVSGLATAWMLKDACDVVLYEREAWLGGHARTITVHGVPAETGFKYMFDATHAGVLALIRLLGVRTRRVRTSASVRFADGTSVALPPRSLSQAAALARHPIARRGAAALARVQLEAARVAREVDWSRDLASFLGERFAPDLCASFLLPFFAASWGFPVDVIARFAAYDVVKVVGKGWGGFLEVDGGASRYIDALVAELSGVEVRRATPVRAVVREGSAYLVEADDVRCFDQVVLALPAYQVGSIVRAEALRAACARFRYQPTEIVIHRDASFMPTSRGEWGVVNYTIEDSAAFLTEWCGHIERRDVFRTWLPSGRPPPRDVVHRQAFEHLVVTPESLAAQREIARLQGEDGLFLTGMYVTDVDVQESALRSAIAVARRLAPSSPNLRRLLQALENERPNISLP